MERSSCHLRFHLHYLAPHSLSSRYGLIWVNSHRADPREALMNGKCLWKVYSQSTLRHYRSEWMTDIVFLTLFSRNRLMNWLLDRVTERCLYCFCDSVMGIQLVNTETNIREESLRQKIRYREHATAQWFCFSCSKLPRLLWSCSQPYSTIDSCVIMFQIHITWSLTIFGSSKNLKGLIS